MIENLDHLAAPDPMELTALSPGAPGKFEGVKNVLLDADDTLWENNLFFLASMEWLCNIGCQLGHTHQATIALLNHWETINIARMGYGYDSYEASLLMTIRALVARSGNGHAHGGYYLKARKWIHFLCNHPIVWLPGVVETLPKLTQRFKTIIVTKGDQNDQMNKVIRSGKKEIFHAAQVVPHKTPQDYFMVLDKYNLNPDETVMVGNSPRSDINQAKRAGLRTIFIPHSKSWFRENEPITNDNPPTIEIWQFAQLLDVLEG